MRAVRGLLLVAVAWWLRQGGALTVTEGCQHACGNVPLRYPFGLDLNCALSKEFLLHCDTNTTNGRPQQLMWGNITVRKISPEDSTMVISLPEIRECNGVNTSYLLIDLSSSPQYRLSDTRNNLTVLGCDTYALISDRYGMFRSGCISYCSSNVNFTKDNTCTGLGCCQAAIPKGLQKLRIKIDSIGRHVSVAGFNPCGLAFVVDRRSFNISTRKLPGIEDSPKQTDVVLDWMVGQNLTCDQAQSSNKASYPCGRNTYCSNYEDGSGYRCFCNKGYGGNPYGPNHGCQDIDECKYPKEYPCTGICQNLKGSYRCFPLAAILGIVGGAFVIGASASASNTWKWRIRKINFRRNGGEHLKRAREVRIFTEAELAKATGNFDESKKLGEDGFGPVYRGRLEGDAKVEIMVKKPNHVHKHLVRKDFQHELKIVMKISTKYVLKLQGICLETKIPLLVYEYVSNGTLFEHIHSNGSIILRSWKNRLKIATEAALALKQIHSCAIIHGNVKSRNILLDQDCSVKVSDIGTSVLVSSERSHIAATDIEGMLGYIDPEYLKTCKLSLKSDVYSFGAVLVELLTGKKPTDCDTKSEESTDIIPYFVSSVKDEKLSNVIDFEADSEEMDEVKKVAKIAVKCLEQSSRKRPTMGEVAQQLAAIDASLIDEGENEGTTLEVNVKTDISLTTQVADEATGQGTSSCLSCLGIDSACPCI